MPYLSSFLLSQRWRFQRTPLVLFRGIKSELAYTKVSGVVSQHFWRPGSLWHVLSSSMLKNKLFFSLVFLKLMSAFRILLLHIKNRQLWIAVIIFTLVFHIFLKSWSFFPNCSSPSYIILTFLLQSYKVTELQPF